MAFVVALLCWFLLSIPAAVILGRMLGGTIGRSSAPLGIAPSATARKRFART